MGPSTPPDRQPPATRPRLAELAGDPHVGLGASILGVLVMAAGGILTAHTTFVVGVVLGAAGFLALVVQIVVRARRPARAAPKAKRRPRSGSAGRSASPPP